MKLKMNPQWCIILLDGVGLNWEPIERLGDNGSKYTSWAKVIGVWLVETCNPSGYGDGLFVPDPEHEWVLADDNDVRIDPKF